MKTCKSHNAFPGPDEEGLTKREYFAVHILVGMLANSERMYRPSSGSTEQTAVAAADRLIEELNK